MYKRELHSTMDDWEWFRKGSHAAKSKSFPKSINWSALAHDKRAALDMIRRDPNVLFKVVDSVSSCMCGGTCGKCELDDVVFLELLIEARTLTEKDLCEIATATPLDWHKICSKVPPFSLKTLVKYADEMDWDYISQSRLYVKDIEFVKKFHHHIKWDIVCRPAVSPEEYSEYMGLIPLKTALRYTLLSLPHVQSPTCFPKIVTSTCFPELLHGYTIKEIESLEDRDDKIRNAVMQFQDIFVEKCYHQLYLPQKYQEALRHCKKTNLVCLLKYCKPTEDYIRKHMAFALDREAWMYLSKGEIPLSEEFVLENIHRMNVHEVVKWQRLDLTTMVAHKLPNNIICRYQTLTPEYIDEHADVVDWYAVCEYQDLPEWLIRKHLDKINWGQISQYQKLSREFVAEFKDRINFVKLESNPKCVKFQLF
jgi:hypothetical protein